MLVKHGHGYGHDHGYGDGHAMGIYGQTLARALAKAINLGAAQAHDQASSFYERPNLNKILLLMTNTGFSSFVFYFCTLTPPKNGEKEKKEEEEGEEKGEKSAFDVHIMINLCDTPTVLPSSAFRTCTCWPCPLVGLYIVEIPSSVRFAHRIPLAFSGRSEKNDCSSWRGHCSLAPKTLA